MTGDALSARAIGDAGPRALASEWGGPGPVLPTRRLHVARGPARRVTLRKP